MVRFVSSAVKANGLPVSQDAVTLAGIGEAPEVVVVVATSSTTVEVRFSETIRNVGDVANISTYVFSDPPLALSVLKVLGVSENVVTLQTSEQDSSILYTLPVHGVIQDNAQKAVVSPVDSPMLGFTAPQAVAQSLQLDMYKFLPANLRQIDLKDGREFIKRFFSGPQELWRVINQNILDLLNLQSIVKTRDEHVSLLQDLLSWADKLSVSPHARALGT